MPEPSSERVVAATDGSAHPSQKGAAGAAWVVVPPGRHDATGCWAAFGFARATVNYAELFAIMSVLRCVPRDLPLLVVTDSEYAMLACRDRIPKWRKAGWMTAGFRGQPAKPVANRDLLEEIDALLRARDVTWRHVRSHVPESQGGHPLNDVADRLCGAARAAVEGGRPIDGGPGWTDPPGRASRPVLPGRPGQARR